MRSIYKQMRLFVMFDMPMDTPECRKDYTRFRRFLLKDGFLMMQFSVYTRFCHNISDCEKHIIRIKKNTPQIGDIRILKTTESQYENMIILTEGRVLLDDLELSSDTIVIE